MVQFVRVHPGVSWQFLISNPFLNMTFLFSRGSSSGAASALRNRMSIGANVFIFYNQRLLCFSHFVSRRITCWIVLVNFSSISDITRQTHPSRFPCPLGIALSRFALFRLQIFLLQCRYWPTASCPYSIRTPSTMQIQCTKFMTFGSLS